MNQSEQKYAPSTTISHLKNLKDSLTGSWTTKCNMNFHGSSIKKLYERYLEMKASMVKCEIKHYRENTLPSRFYVTDPTEDHLRDTSNY